MTDSFPSYRRLSYSGRIQMGLLMPGKSSLWIADDHLLCLNQYGFIVRLSEEYKRFYFPDIQAISIEPHSGRRRENLVWGIPALLLSGLGAWLYWGSPAAGAVSLFAWIPALVLALLVIVNTVRGPACRVRIHTAVQVAEIPALGRLDRARDFMRRLSAEIGGVQGMLPQQEILDRAARLPARPERVPEVEAKAPYGGGCHLALFILMLCDALLSVVPFLHPNAVLYWIDQLLFVPATVSLVAALIFQAGRPLPRLLKGVTWAVLAWTAVFLCVGGILGVKEQRAHGKEARSNPYALTIRNATTSPWHDRRRLWIDTASLASSVGLLVPGLALTLSFRRRLRG